MQPSIPSVTKVRQPKNYNQASYARNITRSRSVSKKNSVDDLLKAEYLCKKPGKQFIREVKSAPEAMCVIMSDAQLSETYLPFAHYQNGALLKHYW